MHCSKRTGGAGGGGGQEGVVGPVGGEAGGGQGAERGEGGRIKAGANKEFILYIPFFCSSP